MGFHALYRPSLLSLDFHTVPNQGHYLVFLECAVCRWKISWIEKTFDRPKFAEILRSARTNHFCWGLITEKQAERELNTF